MSLTRDWDVIYSISDGDVGIVYIVRQEKSEILITTLASVGIVLYKISGHPCIYEEDNDIEQNHAQNSPLLLW